MHRIFNTNLIWCSSVPYAPKFGVMKTSSLINRLSTIELFGI